MLNNTFKKYTLIGAACLSLILPALTQADETTPKTYQVELIIFSHITAAALNAEHWPILSKTPPNLSKAIELSPTDSDTGRRNDLYTLLPERDFALQHEADTLDKDPDYEVLLHIAWRQPVMSRRSTKPIHLYGGAAYDDNGNPLTLNSRDLEPYDTQTNWQVDGLFSVSVLRYLTASFNLQFAAPRDSIVSLSHTDNFANVDGNLVYFDLKQNRRMRSKELNYIDYPLYGALIKVTPITKNGSQKAK